MHNFPQPAKAFAPITLAETDKALPQKLDANLRYAFFSTIATGGKSLIKSCKDLHLSRFVCYKTLRPEFVDDEVEKIRFLREARVSALLQHPNTVPTYEVGRDNRGNYYFTMKLVHGYTLREVFDYRERYDLFQLVDVIVQVAQALEYAHQYGVAHRDIKPENVLVGPFGEVLLLDWGLAKVWETPPSQVAPQGASIGEANEEAARGLDGGDSTLDLTFTRHGKLQGTVSYMSPEQIERDPGISYKTDMFSLGAVLYEALCGATPPQGDTIDQIVRSTLDDTPQPPSQLTTARVPELLEKIAMRCLQKDPEDRYADMSEVIRLLQQDWYTDH